MNLNVCLCKISQGCLLSSPRYANLILPSLCPICIGSLVITSLYLESLYKIGLPLPHTLAFLCQPSGRQGHRRQGSSFFRKIQQNLKITAKPRTGIWKLWKAFLKRQQNIIDNRNELEELFENLKTCFNELKIMFSKDTFDMEDTQKNVCDLSNNDIS